MTLAPQAPHPEFNIEPERPTSSESSNCVIFYVYQTMCACWILSNEKYVLFCFVKEYFNFDESTKNAALATILHPAFKLRWVAREDLATVEKLKKWFFTTLQEYCSAQLHSGAVSGLQHDNDDLNSKTLDFFTFMDSIEPQQQNAGSLQSRGEIQGLQYLDDSDKTLQSLKQYPLVRDLFIKYNVALPSSAAVERLFSIAGMVATAKRNRLRPALFESLLLQRVNYANKL